MILHDSSVHIQKFFVILSFFTAVVDNVFLLVVLFRHEKTHKHAEVYTNMYVYRTGYLQFRIIPGIHWGDHSMGHYHSAERQ